VKPRPIAAVAQIASAGRNAAGDLLSVQRQEPIMPSQGQMTAPRDEAVLGPGGEVHRSVHRPPSRRTVLCSNLEHRRILAPAAQSNRFSPDAPHDHGMLFVPREDIDPPVLGDDDIGAVLLEIAGSGRTGKRQQGAAVRSPAQEIGAVVEGARERDFAGGDVDQAQGAPTHGIADPDRQTGLRLQVFPLPP
jgi:hypothetical protein